MSHLVKPGTWSWHLILSLFQHSYFHLLRSSHCSMYYTIGICLGEGLCWLNLQIYASYQTYRRGWEAISGIGWVHPRQIPWVPLPSNARESCPNLKDIYSSPIICSHMPLDTLPCPLFPFVEQHSSRWSIQNIKNGHTLTNSKMVEAKKFNVCFSMVTANKIHFILNKLVNCNLHTINCFC